MMGPEKLSTIRATLRRRMKMSDAELDAWTARVVNARPKRTMSKEQAEKSLRLLLEELVNASKRRGRK